MVRLVSWNVRHLPVWDELPYAGVDIALLQEAPEPPCGSDGEWTLPIDVIPAAGPPWATHGWEKRAWRTAIARLSDSVALEPLTIGDTAASDWKTLQVSRPGTITAARIVRDNIELFTVVSVYAPWERPISRDRPMWADGSAHRILSDLAPLLWDQRRRPVLVAGDWNILYRYGEHGDEHFGRRYRGVFDRADELGLRFVGPQHPNGRQADPWPDELPRDSLCVPTFFHSKQTRETATRQLDFVFASARLAERVSSRALNDPAEWGPSDHCRVIIEVDL